MYTRPLLAKIVDEKRPYKSVLHFGTDKADVYIFEPNIDMTHDETQEYIDKEVSPIFGKMIKGIHTEYTKEFEEETFTETFDEYYENRVTSRGCREMLAEAKAIGLKDVTDDYYSGRLKLPTIKEN